MSRDSDLKKLAVLADLVLDQRLKQLREAAAARDRSRQQIEAIGPAEPPADLPAVTAGMVALAYNRWAEIRRSELNTVVARQTAMWIEAKADAATAFGRAWALREMAQKPKRK